VTASVIATVLVVLAVLALFAPRPKDSTSSAPAAAPAAPALSPSAAKYLQTADAANHRLQVANDSYKKDEFTNLAAAKADLRSEVATENLFDQQLAQIPFPLSDASIVRALILANQQRAALTARQARTFSLARLRSFDTRHGATDAAVEVQVRLLRKALHLAPPTTS
jgi:hypothetical protein